MKVYRLKSLAAAWLCVLSFFTSYGSDSTLFIGRVWYLQDTNEFYTSLSFKESVDEAKANREILSQLDSTISKEYYLSRKVVDASVAKKYFDLEKFKRISIYTQEHQLVSNAAFKRVEYYEDMIDGMFIAVFDPGKIDEAFKSELIFYAVSLELQPYLIDKFKHEEITKSQLDKNIIKFIKYNKEGLLKSKHFEIKQGNLDKVSILSIEDLENYTYNSYLLEHDGNRIKILKKLNGDYVFWDLLPVPYLVHEKPVFIVEIIIPDSDYTGYMLAIYNGTDYDLQNKMGIKM